MKIRVKRKRNGGMESVRERVNSQPSASLAASGSGVGKLAGDNGDSASNFAEGVYRDLFLGLYDAVLIVDEGGKILDANRRGEYFFSFSRDELRGMNITDLMEGMTRSMLITLASNISQGRYTVLNANCLRKSKETFTAEIALSSLDLNGRLGLVFSVRNESRRHNIQTQLRNEHNALQNAASGIVISDREGTVEFVNKAFLELWGYSENAAERNFALKDLWFNVEQAEELMDAPGGGRNWGGELLAVKSDGTPFWVQATSAPNRDETGQIVGAVFSFVDISERYKAEESIRKEVAGQIDQARAKDEFSGLLNIIRIEDLFQLIDSTGKSGCLRIIADDGNELGEVRFADGKIVSAVAGELLDKEAIIEMLRAGGERFDFNRGDPEEFPMTIQESTMGILLEASRVLDEDR